MPSYIYVLFRKKACINVKVIYLQAIATSMEMDTSQPDMFWKDFSATELNVAVVTSFQVKKATRYRN